MKELALYAMEILKGKGVDYADIRITRYNYESYMVQDLSPKLVNLEETFGFGIRVLYDGAWGFASSSKVSKTEIERVAKRALDIAKSSSMARGNFRVKLASEPVHVDKFETPIEIDPFSIPVEEKLGLLMEINETMLKVKEIVKAVSRMQFRRREQIFASTEGSIIETIIYTSNAGYTAFAVGNNDAQTRSFQDYPLNAGYEHIKNLGLLENAERIAEEARMKLYAEEPDEEVLPHNS